MKTILIFLLGILPLTSWAQTLVKDIFVGLTDSDPRHFVDLNGTAFFVAMDSLHGAELWKSDGTEAGTVMVKDINPGTGPGTGSVNSAHSYSQLTVMGSHVYFSANDGINGYELWKSDGTEAGTIMVKNIGTGSASGVGTVKLFATANALYFQSVGGLWKSDGTEAGTQLLASPNGSGTSAIENFYEFNSLIFFSASDSVHGKELWKSDGTAVGTVFIKDINPGTDHSTPSLFTRLNDSTLIFKANDGVHGVEVWKTDGTTAGTQLVKDMNPGVAHGMKNQFILYHNHLFFAAEDSTQLTQLWKTDGTDAGTVRVKEIFPTGHANPNTFIVFNDKLYFFANDGVHGMELWTTDGTTAGTNVFVDLTPGPVSGATGDPAVGGDRLYFAADDGVNMSELWATDGTVAGTLMINDICPGACEGGPSFLTAVGNKLFFVAWEAASSWELHKIDITLPETGIANTENNIALVVFPNPASQYVKLVAENEVKVAVVYNLQGQQVAEATLDGNQAHINLGPLANGMYIIKATDNNGNTGITKLLKQ